MSEPDSAASSPTRPPLLRRISGRLLRPVLATVALGAAGNIVLGWVTARGADLTRANLLGQPLFYLAVLLAFVPWATHAARLMVWARFLGRPLPLPDVLRIVFANDIGSAITPTAAGGGYAKIALLVERGYAAGTAASLMILGSIEDYIFFAFALPAALFVLGADGLPVVHQATRWLHDHVAVPALIVAGGAGVLLLFRQPITRRLGSLWRDFADVFRLIAQRGKRRFGLTLALTTVHWSCRYMATALLLTCLGVPLDPLLVFLLQWVIFTAALMVPTPGGMIGAEAAFYFVYRGIIPDSVLPAAVAGWRLLTFYAPLAGAAIGFTILQRTWRPLAGGGDLPVPSAPA